MKAINNLQQFLGLSDNEIPKKITSSNHYGQKMNNRRGGGNMGNRRGADLGDNSRRGGHGSQHSNAHSHQPQMNYTNQGTFLPYYPSSNVSQSYEHNQMQYNPYHYQSDYQNRGGNFQVPMMMYPGQMGYMDPQYHGMNMNMNLNVNVNYSNPQGMSMQFPVNFPQPISGKKLRGNNTGMPDTIRK